MITSHIPKLLKKNNMVRRIHLNTLMDTMIMMLLDYYMESFYK